MIVEAAIGDLPRRARDGLGEVRVEDAQRRIGLGRRPLDQAERADQRRRHALLADREIADRALCLRAPVAVCGHVDRAHRIGFAAV